MYKGNSWCQQSCCKTCNHIKSIERFESSLTGKTYSIKASTNCETANVVYMTECIKCNKEYVGETEIVLHIQMNGHRSDIKHQRLEKPVAAHFNSEGHSLQDVSIFVINQIHRVEQGSSQKGFPRMVILLKGRHSFNCVFLSQ